MYKIKDSNTGLQEFFSVPYGLEVVAKIDNTEVYGSKSLNIAFLKSISETQRSKPLFDTINKLVWEKRIIPCWKSKNILNLIKYKLFAEHHEKTSVAVFYPITKKIFVLIDNNINKFGFSSNDWLAQITIHELCHLLSNLNPSAFLKTFKPIFDLFYSQYFTLVFELTKKPDVNKFISFIFNEIENGGNSLNILKYFSLISAITKESELPEVEVTKLKLLYIKFIRLVITNYPLFIKERSNFYVLISLLKESYKKLVGSEINKVSSFYYQELLYPSEVIAIMSEMNSPYRSKIYSGLKSI